MSILDLQERPSRIKASLAASTSPSVSRAAFSGPSLSKEEPAERSVPEEASALVEENPEDFEIVLGRRQIASLLFVATIVLMLFVAGSYMAGRSLGTKAGAQQALDSAPPIILKPEPPPEPVKPAAEPAPAKTESSPVVSNIAKQEPVKPEPPIFAEPAKGALYLQMGAVEKGVAVVFAEGLRRRGLSSFVAPGPSEKIFRVLIGPFPDSPSYQKAKESVDQIGLATFARRYQN